MNRPFLVCLHLHLLIAAHSPHGRQSDLSGKSNYNTICLEGVHSFLLPPERKPTLCHNLTHVHCSRLICVISPRSCLTNTPSLPCQLPELVPAFGPLHCFPLNLHRPTTKPHLKQPLFKKSTLSIALVQSSPVTSIASLCFTGLTPSSLNNPEAVLVCTNKKSKKTLQWIIKHRGAIFKFIL